MVKIPWTDEAIDAIFDALQENGWDIESALNAAVTAQFNSRMAFHGNKLWHGEPLRSYDTVVLIAEEMPEEL